jgi:hypothetical protein
MATRISIRATLDGKISTLAGCASLLSPIMSTSSARWFLIYSEDGRPRSTILSLSASVTSESRMRNGREAGDSKIYLPQEGGVDLRYEVNRRVLLVISFRFEYSVREGSLPLGVIAEIGRREERGQLRWECEMVVVINVFGPVLVLRQQPCRVSW